MIVSDDESLPVVAYIYIFYSIKRDFYWLQIAIAIKHNCNIRMFV